MKLKFTTAPSATPSAPAAEPATPVSAAPKLSLKFGKKNTDPQEAAPSSSADPAKVKRKYTKKPKDENGDPIDPTSKQKRKAKEIGASDVDGSATKKIKDEEPKAGKLKIRVPSMSTATPVVMGAPPVPKIHIPARVSLSARTASTPILKVKAKGHIPVRPLGVGYDSEGEDIEVDPAIESQFVLRMQPGDDCEYLREAIASKKIGVSPREGGADIAMKFFDKDGRRGMVSIRGKHYSAFLLDLPCIIEGMKSWDRRGWYKSADICQIMIVDKQMKDEAEIRAAAVPREIDQMHYQYPHGLTPPMHFVRKRRFRRRMNYRTIEHVEDEVERLLKEDEAAIAAGGKSEYKLIDPDRQSDEEDAQGEDEEEGQYGDIVPGYAYEEQNEEDYEDADDIAAMMEREFAQGAEEDLTAAGEDGMITSAVMHASPDTLAAPALPLDTGASPAATDGTGTGNDGEDDDLFSGDDDDDGDDDEVDEEELERQREKAQQREEIEDIRKEIAEQEAKCQKQTNPLMRKKELGKLKSLKEDLRVKLASIGEEEE